MEKQLPGRENKVDDPLSLSLSCTYSHAAAKKNPFVSFYYLVREHTCMCVQYTRNLIPVERANACDDCIYTPMYSAQQLLFCFPSKQSRPLYGRNSRKAPCNIIVSSKDFRTGALCIRDAIINQLAHRTRDGWEESRLPRDKI